MHSSSVRYILKEAKIRLYWAVFCVFVTSATCYWFSEDFFFGLATPYLKVSKTSFFICTQITESLSTYIVISITLGIFFCSPYIFYQIWCFFIPSCNSDQRRALRYTSVMSLVAFFLILSVTFVWIIPNIWLFLYKLTNTGSGAQFFLIKLQPKIYDFSVLTLRFLIISGICSQIPIMIICSVQYHLISIQTLLKSRQMIAFISLLVAALITPPDIWCQLSAWFCILFLKEFAIFAAIVQLQYFNHVRTIEQLLDKSKKVNSS